MTIQTDFKEVGENYLEHYGKMGMKWGHRNAASGATKTDKPKKVKVTTADIKSARARQSVRERKYEESQGDFIVARTNKGRDRAEKVMRKHEKEYFLGKDAKTADRMTRGEKIGTTLVLGITGLVFAGMVAQAGRDAQAGKRQY